MPLPTRLQQAAFPERTKAAGKHFDYQSVEIQLRAGALMQINRYCCALDTGQIFICVENHS